MPCPYLKSQSTVCANIARKPESILDMQERTAVVLVVRVPLCAKLPSLLTFISANVPRLDPLLDNVDAELQSPPKSCTLSFFNLPPLPFS